MARDHASCARDLAMAWWSILAATTVVLITFILISTQMTTTTTTPYHANTFTRTTPDIVQFVHVHKAAGSSVCKMMQDGGYTPDDGGTTGFHDCNPGGARRATECDFNGTNSQFCYRGYDVCWLANANHEHLEEAWAHYHRRDVRVLASEGPLPHLHQYLPNIVTTTRLPARIGGGGDETNDSVHVAWITGLREPVARQLSEYRWFKSFRCEETHLQRRVEMLYGDDGDIPNLNTITQVDQCGCMQAKCNVTRLEYLSEMCDNYMTRTFCPSMSVPGKPLNRQALLCAKKILSRFDFVYDVARMDESMRKLSNLLAIWFPDTNINTTTTTIITAPVVNAAEREGQQQLHDDPLSPEEENILREKTSLDAELYAYARQLL